jgi:hypothetical protein
LFILTITHWNITDKQQFDDTWKITPSLDWYIAKSENSRSNILESLQGFEDAKLKSFGIIAVPLPFLVAYHFYMLQRIQDAKRF